MIQIAILIMAVMMLSAGIRSFQEKLQLVSNKPITGVAATVAGIALVAGAGVMGVFALVILPLMFA